MYDLPVKFYYHFQKIGIERWLKKFLEYRKKFEKFQKIKSV